MTPSWPQTWAILIISSWIYSGIRWGSLPKVCEKNSLKYLQTWKEKKIYHHLSPTYLLTIISYLQMLLIYLSLIYNLWSSFPLASLFIHICIYSINILIYLYKYIMHIIFLLSIIYIYHLLSMVLYHLYITYYLIASISYPSIFYSSLSLYYHLSSIIQHLHLYICLCILYFLFINYLYLSISSSMYCLSVIYLPYIHI